MSKSYSNGNGSGSDSERQIEKRDSVMSAGGSQRSSSPGSIVGKRSSLSSSGGGRSVGRQSMGQMIHKRGPSIESTNTTHTVQSM